MTNSPAPISICTWTDLAPFKSLDLLSSAGLVGIGDRRQQHSQLIVAKILEIFSGLAHARRLDPGGGIVRSQAGIAGRLVEAAHDGEFPADSDGLVVALQQRLAGALDVHGGDGGDRKSVV